MSVPGPTLGPCEAWIDGDDVAACCSEFSAGSDSAALLALVAMEASMALYEISGARFNGLCRRTVRPCATGTDCWGSGVPIGGMGSWYWVWGGGIGGWAWRNEDGPLCGCKPVSTVMLAGYPVREITEVKIGGEVLPPLDDNGNRNYRLDEDWTTLTRMDDPGPPLVQRKWPTCQNLALDDTELGTFSISYRWGVDPPELARRAAAQIACQLLLSCGGSDDCLLDDGVTRVERQGVIIDRQLLAGFFDPTKPTGLTSVDLFLKAYGTAGGSRPPAVWSPGNPQYARRLG